MSTTTATRRPCHACGTWTCPDCGWQRHGVNLSVFQDCARCGGTDGSFRATRHQVPGIWDDHNPAAGPTCRVWAGKPYEPPYKPFAGPCAHPTCQVIAWGRVITGKR